MKDCYYSRKNKSVRCFLLICSAFFGGITIYGLFIIFAYSTEDSMIIPYGLLMISVGVFAIIEVLLQYRLLNRKYKVDSTGLYIQHSRNNQQFYPWKHIYQVCLCNIHQGSHERVYDTVIWCVVGAIKEGPPDIKQRWKSPHYGIWHFHSVITIEYSAERLSEFNRFYRRSIADYR